MARIFLTSDEAIAWGLKKPKAFDTLKMREKILIRVLAGTIVLLVALLASIGGPQLAAILAATGG